MTDIVDAFTLKFEWKAGGVWLVTCPDNGIKGMVFAAYTFQEMLNRIGTLTPDLMHANDQTFACDRPAVELDLLYTVAVELDDEAVNKPSSQAEVIRDAGAEIARLRTEKGVPRW